MLKSEHHHFDFVQKLPGKDQSRMRIYYYDNLTEIIEEGSEYTGRITVSHSYDPKDVRGTAILTIDKVELSDQREFICMVHSVLKESGEGHTRLQVFSKTNGLVPPDLEEPGQAEGSPSYAA